MQKIQEKIKDVKNIKTRKRKNPGKQKYLKIDANIKKFPQNFVESCKKFKE